MPDTNSPLRMAGFGTLLAVVMSASGCLYAGVGAANVAVTPDRIVTNTTSAELRVAPGYPDDIPTRYELAYARDTARVLFKRNDAERSERFVLSDPVEGYGLCLRAGSRLALLVFPRRLYQAGLSQAADDVEIRRGDLDTAPCRARRDYVPAA